MRFNHFTYWIFMGVKVSDRYHGRPAATQPNNRGMANVAAPAITKIWARAARKYQESIIPDSHGIRVFQRVFPRGSIPCSCSQFRMPSTQHTNFGKPGDFIGDPTNVHPTDLNVELPENNAPDAKPGDLPVISMYRIRMQDLDVGSDTVHKPDAGNETEMDTLHGNHDSGKIQRADLMEKIMTRFAEADKIMTGGDLSACAICLGSGYTNGYELLGGKRIILDFTNYVPMKLEGVSIRRDVDSGGPWRGEFSESTNCVTWFVELPAYFEKVSAARVWNNMNRVYEGILEAREQSTDAVNLNPWVELTPDWINGRNGSNNKLEIRYRITQTISDSIRLISHVELVIETRPLFRAQFPNPVKAIDFTSAVPREEINIEIEPAVGRIYRESYIHDVDDNSFWQITQTKEQSDAQDQVYGTDITAILVQPGRVSEVLKINPNVRSNFQAFRGLENIQGDLTSDLPQNNY